MTADIETTESTKTRHPLRGLLVAQFLGAFNDNAWKQVVIVLAVDAVLAASASSASASASTSKETQTQAMTSFVQVVFMIPLFLFSLPAGVVADRFSKRSVILAMKVLELALMLAGTLALWFNPFGGYAALAVLGVLGIQAAIFSPAKYGILPEILPHEKLSAGNGLLEMCTNLAIIAGVVAGGVIVATTEGHAWLGGLFLSLLSAMGLGAAWFVRAFLSHDRKEGWSRRSRSPGTRSARTGSSGWRFSGKSSSGRSPALCRRRSRPMPRSS